MRISDWSSDVCSSDLNIGGPVDHPAEIDAGPDAPQPFRDIGRVKAGQVERNRKSIELSGVRIFQIFRVGQGHEAAEREPIVAGRGVEIEALDADPGDVGRTEEHTSELQSIMRSSYAVFC